MCPLVCRLEQPLPSSRVKLEPQAMGSSWCCLQRAGAFCELGHSGHREGVFLDSVIAQELLGPCEGTGLFRALLAPLTLRLPPPPSIPGARARVQELLAPALGWVWCSCLPPCPLCSFPCPLWSPRHGGHPKGTMRPREGAWGQLCTQFPDLCSHWPLPWPHVGT